MVRDETRHVISHEPGEHESVQVFVNRVPSTRNENTDEPQVDRTPCDHSLTSGNWEILHMSGSVT